MPYPTQQKLRNPQAEMDFELWHPRVPAAAERQARYQQARVRIHDLAFGSPERLAVVNRVWAICAEAGTTAAEAIDKYHQWPDNPASATWLNAAIKAASEI